MAKRRGAPPPRLTGGRRVRSLDSPWWDRVMSEMLARPGLVGRTLSIEELAGMVPRYESGGRPRPRAVAKRLSPILELIERGPNGSRGRGATYRIVDRRVESTAGPARTDVEDVVIGSDTDWLLAQVERMTGEE